MHLSLACVSLLITLGIAPQSSSPAGAVPSSQPLAGQNFVRVYPSDTAKLVLPKAIQTPHVQYTPEAFHARAQGRIDLDVTVGADGHVRDAMVTHGIENAPELDARAVAKLSEWLFEPGTLDGQPVAVRTVVTFTFSLR